MSLCEAWPEAIVRFDPFKGEARNSDLLAHALCSRGKALISVEAKADETFNETIGKSYDAAMKRPESNAPERMRRLARAVLGADIGEVRDLRYQLLYGIAAALSAAQQHDATIAIFVVHEFITECIKEIKQRKNGADLDDFVRNLSRDRNPRLDPGRLLGPFGVPGNDHIPKDVALFIGKAIRDTRLPRCSLSMRDDRVY
ncbi:MAG TPA: hypothetical protein VFC56_01595 [Stellaceae bacterium]|nr:hypothetical protein [Stellaceae bacterium]